MLKEFDNINKLNLNDINYLKSKKEELGNKIKIIENENNIYKIQLDENNKEIALMKNKLKNTENNYIKFPYKKNKTIKNIKFKNFKKEIYNDENEENNENLNINSDSNYNEKFSNKTNEIKNNNYITQLNKKNLNDLDAIYFFDKIYNNSKTNEINGKNNNNNYKSNKGDIVPQLNLDPEYIEDRKNKELLKLEEANLTPFQKIALQFEVS